MWALDQPYDPSPRSFLAGTPWALLAFLAAGLGVGLSAVELGYLAAAQLSTAVVWTVQIALAVTAVGWALADDPACPARALGLVRGPSRAALAAAAAIGSGLSMHLLFTASRTLGYPIALERPSQLLSSLVYDIALNVPSAELFFRAGLFNRAQRRWSFGPALALSTLACVVRYLLDPALLKIPEVMLGAVVYVALLSVGNAWLFWWSGSLIPPLIASLQFFIAYRVLRME